jgi:hypothetical protein
MTYEELRQRCCRIIGLHQDAKETPLDCTRLLHHFQDSGRAIAAEMLARELAEYVWLVQMVEVSKSCDAAREQSE